jgi:hypothetical protein
MRVTPEDLIRAFQGKGDVFEAFVHDLVRAVGRYCGVDPVNIDWDYRTTVKDGGRDLVVKAPNQRPDKRFLPSTRSVWSLKSGEAGISPASLKNEILDKKHPKVRKALQDGWVYVTIDWEQQHGSLAKPVLAYTCRDRGAIRQTAAHPAPPPAGSLL